MSTFGLCFTFLSAYTKWLKRHRTDEKYASIQDKNKKLAALAADWNASEDKKHAEANPQRITRSEKQAIFATFIASNPTFFTTSFKVDEIGTLEEDELEEYMYCETQVAVDSGASLSFDGTRLLIGKNLEGADMELTPEIYNRYLDFYTQAKQWFDDNDSRVHVSLGVYVNDY